jgi:hypothetical protein
MVSQVGPDALDLEFRIVEAALETEDLFSFLPKIIRHLFEDF